MLVHDPSQALLELLATMHALRAPRGCPWDAAQTPESLTPFILEEACELIEAIETGSAVKIVEELGDLLLQIVFQAEIFSERQLFDFADIAAGINAKLIRRHPHVFGGVDAVLSEDELDRQWERIKSEEQARTTTSVPDLIGRIPMHLPALQRAQKLVVRARRSGLDLDAELSLPVTMAIDNDDDLGRALLALVGEAERHGIDAEQALRRTLHTLFGALVIPHDNMDSDP